MFSIGTTSGERGGILEQLDAGVRFLELDVFAHNFDSVGYTIGHGYAGACDIALALGAFNTIAECRGFLLDLNGCDVDDGTGCEVDHGKPETDTLHNPSSDVLVDWLRQISSWSNMHPTHSPITVGLDIKHTFNTSALDAMVRSEFLSIFTPADLAAHREVQGGAGWPLVDHMRGKVLFVLTGDISTRVAYLDNLEDALGMYNYTGSGPSDFSGAGMFSEYSPGEPVALKEASHFFAASSTVSRDDYEHIECIKLRSCPFRVYRYDLAGSVYAGGGPTPTFPAADYPYAPSYNAELAATGRLPAAV